MRASSGRRRLRLFFRNHRYIDGHAEIVAGRADKTAGDRNRLADVTSDGNAYQIGVHALALAACIGLDVPVLAQDNSGLVAGKDAWARASCFDCHGSMAQGGSGGDYPVGPSLRNITFGKETMVGIVSCGIPGTPMPAWLIPFPYHDDLMI
jgi:mono/diheme cytochrome c family protein